MASNYAFDANEQQDGTIIERGDDSDYERTSRPRSESGSSESSVDNSTTMRQVVGYDSDDSESSDFSNLELDSLSLQVNISSKFGFHENITSLNISGNRLQFIPSNIALFVNLKSLDVSQNELTSLGAFITKLNALSTLIAANNRLSEKSLSSDFGSAFASSLKILSLGGNQFKTLPSQLYELTELRSLYLGGNNIEAISKDIKRLVNLRVLYLGGNQLGEIPVEIGHLPNLHALSLCENKLKSLPTSIAKLRNLRSLALHKNLLTTLPQEIVKLRGLIELSLRDNPLIVRFVREVDNNPPSLLELAGRCVKRNRIPYSSEQLPVHVVKFLSSAQYCVNPKCKGMSLSVAKRTINDRFFSLVACAGVYFDARVEHIKFIDFCGIYRLPLLQYLCSSQCTNNNTNSATGNSSSEDEADVPLSKMKRVLLG
ncbi:leucine-rich repeat-containing protein 58-like protein [Dinothrombium tinctorium]|uniref:Leucine-rich repeat protein soc-2 homolog n=1 Tax=Dinothrombium tinctorium TaxID=1965070 RepID=A0A443QXL0_9ACAR|nr:leucine-rich repeat-containing protein 58-like protein [Dinothrombium tinctorium]